MNKRISLSLSMFLAFMILTISGLFAQESDTLEIIGKSYSIGEGEVINTNVVIDGGAVSINGVVNGDIEIKGSSVTIGGEVVGNLTIDSSSVSISGNITGNVIGVSAGLFLDEGGLIDGDVDASGTFTLFGEVDGDVKMSSGYLILHGEITGDVGLDGAQIIYEGGHYYGNLYEGELPEQDDKTVREGETGKGGETPQQEEDGDGWFEGIWEDTYLEDLPDWAKWLVPSCAGVTVVILILILLIVINSVTGRGYDYKGRR